MPRGVVTLALALVCAFGSPAWAQTVVFSGANAQASFGGGTHSVVLIDGQYFVFFNDGSGVMYASSLDGVTFSAPAPASGAPASLGFSVARRGNTLGLVWAHNDATGYSLWYREATISNATLTFGTATLVASHATDTRGYLATLGYSDAGTAYIAALEYGQTYTGPAGPGCGSTTRYRPIHYVLQGSWQMRGYCNNFDTLRDPNSLSIAPSGANMIVSSAIDANLSTAIVNDSGELGEPWHMVPAVEHVLAAQMSSVGSLTQTTDVHVLYRDGAGAVTYARQDGTLLDLNTLMADVTVLAPAARNPALSRPTSTAGCYVAVYAIGNSIRRRTFRGSIATLSAENTVYATGAAPTNVSLELDAAMAPALVWQEGSSIRFGFAGDAVPVTLTATPASAPANGTSVITVSSTPLHDACGAAVPAGTLVTVTSSVGAIADVDASAQFAGTQVLADSAGRITFTVNATTPGMALVAAMPITGGTNASVQATFTDPSLPSGCGDGFVDTAAGEQCDSSGVDTAACNATDCQVPRCGDGYVNVAASEDCEAGELCDVTTCTYNFSLGGGCAGCGASQPDGALWIVACVGLLLRRRRSIRTTGRTTTTRSNPIARSRSTSRSANSRW